MVGRQAKGSRAQPSVFRLIRRQATGKIGIASYDHAGGFLRGAVLRFGPNLHVVAGRVEIAGSHGRAQCLSPKA